MADAVTDAAPATAAAPATRSGRDGDKRARRPRGSRGGGSGKHRAAAAADKADVAVGTEDVATARAADRRGRHAKAAPSQRPANKPRGETAEATSAGESTGVAPASASISASDKPARQRKPRERKPRVAPSPLPPATAGGGESHVAQAPPAPAAPAEPEPKAVRQVATKVAKKTAARAASENTGDEHEPHGHAEPEQETRTTATTVTTRPPPATPSKERAKPKDAKKDVTTKKTTRPGGSAKEKGTAAAADDDTDDNEERDASEAVDWSTAAWFTGCDADLGAGYWLLTRSYACNDAAVLASEPIVRRAVALQSLLARLKTELLPQDEHEDDGDDEAKSMVKPKEWTAAEVVDTVIAAFAHPPGSPDDPTTSTPADDDDDGDDDDDDSDQRASSSSATSMVVALLEVEVVDVATELLIGRVERSELELLSRWERHLASLLPADTPDDKEDATPRADGVDKLDNLDGDAETGGHKDEAVAHGDTASATADDAALVLVSPPFPPAAAAGATDGESPPAVVLPPPRPRRRKTAGSVKNAIAHAKAQVAAAIAFHRSYDKHGDNARADAAAGAGAGASASTEPMTQWSREIQRIVDATLVSETDEALRKSVAAQIQHAFRRSPHWRQCEVLLFGSSLSKFGAKTSDLDLCLRATTGNADDNAEDAGANKMSMRELKLRMRRAQQQVLGNGSVGVAANGTNGEGTSRNDDAPFLKELLDKSHKTVDALVNALKKQRKKAAASKSDAKVQRLQLLTAHWQALVVALEFFHGKLVAAAAASSHGSGDGGEKTNARVHTNREAKAAADAYHAALHKQQKKRQKDIYAGAALLARHGCDVKLVIAHARVPVIRFTHAASGFECDLCFDNYHACINTLLLRTYAECDARARQLGIAVKHWAKRRGLNDASQGYLSSYSFVLLVIFFLQRRARVLPSLQDPALLRLAHVEPVQLNGVDVSFCQDVATARAFHTTQREGQRDQTAQSTTTTATAEATSVGSLLLSFFQYYVEEFNFSQHVVSVRAPDKIAIKSSRWGRNKLRAWRFSIEDPLELDRDLGSVLQFRCQQRIVEEMKRALRLLRSGQSFESAVCEADAAIAAEAELKKTTNEKKTNGDGKAQNNAAKKDPAAKKASGRHADSENKKKKKKETNERSRGGGDRGEKKMPQANHRSKRGQDDEAVSGDGAPLSREQRRSDRRAPRGKETAEAASVSKARADQHEQERGGAREKGSRGDRRARGESSKSKEAARAVEPSHEA